MGLLGVEIAGLKEIWYFDNRLQLLFNRLLFRRTSLVVYKLGNREIIVDHHGGDANGTRNCIVSDMYRRFLAAIPLPPNCRVLDLGSNGGGFPLCLALSGASIGELVCVEFNPQTFNRLQFNLARNLEGKHRAINAAVCGKSRQFELVLGMGGTGDNIYQQPTTGHAASGRKVVLPGLTLDEVVSQEFGPDGPIDLCKMDVEGAEFEIFYGSCHDAIRRIRHLLIEIHHGQSHTQAELIERLQRLGFERVDVPGESIEKDVFLFRNTRRVVAAGSYEG